MIRRLLHGIVFAIVALAISPITISSQFCSIESSADIADLDTTSISLDVQGSVNDDLSSPSQGLCGVLIEFEHDFIADIMIVLTAPSGQSITLVGPSIINGSFTGFINWDIAFVPCAAASSPDFGISSVWNNLQNWSIASVYNGSYYPHTGCLEDFDTGSVNGVWTIDILDISMFGDGELIDVTLIFCDPDGVECIDCVANAGDISNSQLSICEASESLYLSIGPVFSGEIPDQAVYDYKYVITENGLIVAYQDDANMDSYLPGNYMVCGLSIIEIDVSMLPPVGSPYTQIKSNINNGEICGALSVECTELMIIDVPDTLVNYHDLCLGDTIFFRNDTLSLDGDYFYLQQEGNCDTVLQISVIVRRIVSYIDPIIEDLSCFVPAISLDGSGSLFDTNTQSLWTTSDGSISSDPTAEIIMVSEPGTYIFALTEGPCISKDTVLVSSTGDSPEITISSDTIDCSLNEVLIDLNASDISTYDWSGPGIVSEVAEDIIVDTSGTYSVTVTANNGCSAIGNIVVVEDYNLPSVTLAGDEITCGVPLSNLSADVDTATLISYGWYLGDLQLSSSTEIEVNQMGTYYFVIEGLNSCLDSMDIIVSIDTTIHDILIDIDSLDCTDSNAEIMISSDGGISNILVTSPSGSVIDVSEFATDTEGEYLITLTQDNGCITEDSFDILDNSANPNFAIFGMDTLYCDVDSIQLVITNIENTNGVHWDGPEGFVSNDFSPWVSLSGAYYVTAFSQEGCTKVDSIIINQDESALLFSVGSSAIDCTIDSVQLTTNLGIGYDFTWSGSGFSSSEAAPYVFTPGVYSVTAVESSTGCIGVEEVEVFFDSIVGSVVIVGDSLSCLNSQSALSVNHDLDETYILWTGPSTYVENTLSINVLNEGTYYVRVEMEGGCFNEDSLRLEIADELPSFLLDDQTLNCNTDSILVQPIIQNSQEYIDSAITLWTGPGGFTSSNLDVYIMNPGDYLLEIISSDGCSEIQSMTVITDTVSPVFNIIVPDEITCNDPEVVLSPSLQEFAYQYQWIGPGTFMSSGLDIGVTVPGEYYLAVTSVNGCSSSSSIAVMIDTLHPTVEAYGGVITCKEGKINLGLMVDTVDYYVEWTGPGNLFSSEESPLVFLPGIYSAQITLENGCQTIDTALVTELIIAPITEVSDSLFIQCDPDEVKLSVQSQENLSYQWFGPLGFASDEATPIVDAPGMYIVISTADNQCSTIDTIQVLLSVDTPSITVSASGPLTCEDTLVNLTVQSADSIVSYLWEGPGNITGIQDMLDVDVPGSYTVTVTGDNGCTTTQSLGVSADTLSPEFSFDDNYKFICDQPVLNIGGTALGPGDFTYAWMTDNGEILSDPSQAQINIGQVGTYVVLVSSNENGCTSLEEILIDREYNQLSSTIEVTSPSCKDGSDGSIEFISVSGGSSPYMYSVDNVTQTDPMFTYLMSGNYTLEVVDSLGCGGTSVANIDDGFLLTLDVGPDVSLTLGESYEVIPQSNDEISDLPTIEWSSPDNLDCIDCFANTFSPTMDQIYALSITNDIGCTASDDLMITVVVEDVIFVPNVFSPNGDMVNDELIIGYSDAVNLIKKLLIYDRWGNLVFEQKNILPNTSDISWDGYFHGQLLSQGVYVYLIDVQLLNGEVKSFIGDLTILR